jgi:hypothetical protein
MVLSLAGFGAAPTTARQGLRIPLLMSCDSSTPGPTPTPTPVPSSPLSGIGSLLGAGGAGSAGSSGSAGEPPSQPATPDDAAPTFTLPAAQLGGSSISFTGLQSVTVVTVPLANGTRTPVLKLVADSITITDFVLDVRKATGPSLVTNSGTMTLRGHVQAYLDSVSATLGNGLGLTLGATTPPPGGELPSTLLRPTLGLVGVTAASITLTPSHQQIHEAG